MRAHNNKLPLPNDIRIAYVFEHCLDHDFTVQKRDKYTITLELEMFYQTQTARRTLKSPPDSDGMVPSAG